MDRKTFLARLKLYKKNFAITHGCLALMLLACYMHPGKFDAFFVAFALICCVPTWLAVLRK